MLLAGDIGGTKTDLAIFSVEGGPHSPLSQTQVHSADYPSLQALVTEFLQKAKTPVERACFDVAGPVIDGRVKVTNLPWAMDEASLANELNFKSVHLINDLEAVARAVPILRSSEDLTCWATGPEWHHRDRGAGHRSRRIISYLGWIEICIS
jgi:glucokinase